MTTESEDSDQLALWPTEPMDTGAQRHESRSRSGRKRPRLSQRRTAPPGVQPVDAADRRPPAVPATANNDDERLWSILEVAHYLAVSKDTIYGWRKSGYGPPASKVGRHLRWRPDDVVEWVERLRQTKPPATE